MNLSSAWLRTWDRWVYRVVFEFKIPFIGWHQIPMNIPMPERTWPKPRQLSIHDVAKEIKRIREMKKKEETK